VDLLAAIPADTRIAIDTAPFIYYIEGNSDYDDAVVQIFEECISSGRNSACTSVITLAEVLTGAIQYKRKDLEAAYTNILSWTPDLELIPITKELSVSAARLRYQYKLKLPDAFQLAAALAAKADFLITNDQDFKKVSEVKIVLLSDLV